MRAGFLVLAVLLAAEASQDEQRCHAPAYFGICDPFVPGVIIARARDGQPIVVLDTWPDGPAERAGICPGDRIVEINQVSAFASTYDGLLRELVSPVAAPVRLQVRRGEREFEVRVDRVRETELAARSGRKFLRARAVAPDQSDDGLERVERIRERHFLARGLKAAGPEWVPADAPDAAVQGYRELLARIRVPLPSVTTRMFESRDDWIAGLTLLVPRDPAGAWVRGVAPGSRAHHAGVYPGDEVLEIDGRPIAGLDRDELARLLLGTRQPRRVRLKLRRAGVVSDVSIETERAATLVAQPFGPESIADARPRSRGGFFLGLELLRSSLLGQTLVEDVLFPSAAWRAGVHVGDVVIAIDGRPVQGLGSKELEALVSPRDSRPLRLEIQRGAASRVIELVAETWKDALGRIGRGLGPNGPAPRTCSE